MQGKALPEPTAMVAVYAGIDVSKAFLDVHLHPCGETLRVANDRPGLRRLKRRLAGLAGVHVVMEATGKYHRAAWRSLNAGGFKVTVTDPSRARLFARACGYLAKTDRLDARLLALMGEALEPEATALPGPGMEALQELVNAQAAAKAEATGLANRHAAAETAFLRAELTRLQAVAQRHVQRLDAEIERRIRAGFCLDLGGSWELVGARPDLAAWSKAIANGHALAAVTGNDRFREGATRIFTTGSFWTASVSMAAAIATIRKLRDTGAVAHMKAMGQRFRDGLDAQARRHGLAIRQSGPVQMPVVLFEDDADRRVGNAFCQEALARGVYLHPVHTMFL